MKLSTQFLLLFVVLSLSVQVNGGGHPGSGGGGGGVKPHPPPPDNSGPGGSTPPPPPDNSGSDGGFQACDPNNRQQACTLEYVPVCGYIRNCEGGDCTLTFGNKCAACASYNVDGYVAGACEDIRTDCDPRNRPDACPLNYVPTCAVFAHCQGPHCFEDTSNSCVACSMKGVAYSLPGACPSNNQGGRTYCDARNRPEICTADYNPVCAHRANCKGDHCYFTAGNACGACADEYVDWHTPGACPGDEDGDGRTYCDASDRPVACTLDYTPVCAHRIHCKKGHCFYTAGNACSACGDSNVDWHTPGECPGDETDDDDDERTYCKGKKRPQACTREYNPVCAHRKDCKRRHCFFTAGNACSACADKNVDWHTPGEC